jgi:hypothetical protein
MSAGDEERGEWAAHGWRSDIPVKERPGGLS